MASDENITNEGVLVAIDFAKRYNTVLVQYSDGKKKAFSVANQKDDYDAFLGYLKSLPAAPIIAFEATGDYHRPLAYRLGCSGFTLRLVSTVAVARTRDALYNTWDKNDPKDTQVILHLLRTGVTQVYREPLLEQTNDIKELSRTHYQVSLRKTQVQHGIMNHFLPLYFPEVVKYFTQSRARWFTRLLYRFPCPSAIIRYALEEFISEAWDVVGRKVNKQGFLKDLYLTAQQSIGLDVSDQSQAMSVFRLVLEEHQELCEKRA